MSNTSYAGNILKVDLSKGKMVNLPTNDYTDRFIGGRGLAAKLYWDTVPPDTGALEPDNCLIFATGPLAGKNMGLVGHADPRGESEYNMLLGERRATNVGSAISQEGLDQSKIRTSSRGEMDARGYDEPSWAQDRRVDVMIAH